MKRLVYKAPGSEVYLDLDNPYCAFRSDFEEGFKFALQIVDPKTHITFCKEATDWDDWLNLIKEYQMADYSKATPEAGEVSGDAINPSHYKQLLVITDTNGKYIDTLQWLEHLQYKPFWRNNMHAFVHAVLDLCADKYLSRMGMKDDETQEMEKALWYFKFATAIMKNGYKPVRVNDIDRILDGTVPAFVAVTGRDKVIQGDNTCYFYDKDKAYQAAGPDGYVIPISRPRA